MSKQDIDAIVNYINNVDDAADGWAKVVYIQSTNF